MSQQTIPEVIASFNEYNNDALTFEMAVRSQLEGSHNKQKRLNIVEYITGKAQNVPIVIFVEMVRNYINQQKLF